jgi:hypothetical protein
MRCSIETKQVKGPGTRTAERSLGGALARQDLALEHELGVGRHQYLGGAALHQLERLAEEPAHDPALVLVDRADRERAERDRRMHADHQRERQGLVARLGDPLELPQVLAGRQMDRCRVAALDLEPVVGAIPDLARGVLREGDRRGEVGPGVALVVDDLRQVVEVDALALEDDFVHRAARHDLRDERVFHRAQIRRLGRLGGRVHGGGEAGPAGVEVGEHRELRALDVLEEQDGPALSLALELHDERGDLEARVDGLRDDLEVAGLAPLDEIEIAPEVLRHRRLGY